MGEKKKWMIRSAAVLIACTMVVTAAPNSIVSASNSSTSGGSSHTEKRPEYKKTTAAAEKYAKNLVSFYGETSVQYAIIDGGDITISGVGGYAIKENKTAPDAFTMYGIASVSKIFTTTAVMKLAEEGKIKLDEPVVTYLPEFKMADPRYKEITVRMLLNHSSGLMGGNLTNAVLYGTVDQTATDNLLENLKKQRLKANPGEFSVYSNDGFSLAELVVERVSGKDFTTYLHQNLLSDFGLKHTNTAGERFVTRKLARSYSTNNQLHPYENFAMIGTGGIYSSASDLVQFAQNFMENEYSTLSQDSLQQMMNPEYRKGMWKEDDVYSAFSFGLGWDQVNSVKFDAYGIKALSKGGDSMDYHSSLIVLPEEEIAMAILSVGGASIYNKIVGEEVLLTYLEEKGRIDRSGEKFPSLLDLSKEEQSMPKELEGYSGYYANNSVIAKVTIEDKKMKVENLAQNMTYKLDYYRDGWFINRQSAIYMQVVQEKNGHTYLYLKQNQKLPGLGEYNVGLYYLQRLTEDSVNPEAVNAWKQRMGKEYFLVNEKYSSYNYQLDLISMELPAMDEFYLGQYIGMHQIVDGTTTQSPIQIPMECGRDLSDWKIENVNGVEYLWQNNYCMIDKESIKELPKGANTNVSVPDSGEGIYYSIPETLDGKTVQIDVPEHAAFIIYDDNKKLVMNSHISGNKKVTLTAGGYVLFVGDAKSEFTVHVLKK